MGFCRRCGEIVSGDNTRCKCGGTSRGSLIGFNSFNIFLADYNFACCLDSTTKILFGEKASDKWSQRYCLLQREERGSCVDRRFFPLPLYQIPRSFKLSYLSEYLQFNLQQCYDRIESPLLCFDFSRTASSSTSFSFETRSLVLEAIGI